MDGESTKRGSVPATTTIEFGFYSKPIDIAWEDVAICSLSDLAETARELAAHPQVSDGWLYAPRTRYHDIATSEPKEHPYPDRVFGLPRSHAITLPVDRASGRADFLVWCLGFLLGVHVTTAEAGYLDAAALRPHGFHDLSLGRRELAFALHHADRFWSKHKDSPPVINRIKAAINCAWIAALPHRLSYEGFLHAYSALEACFGVLLKTMDPNARAQLPERPSHGQRLGILCDQLDIPRPAIDWTKGNLAPQVRNDALHDGLFMGKPWGYATVSEDDRLRGIVLQMHAVIRRALVALLGMKDCDYVRSAVDSRQPFGLDVSAPR